MATCRWLLLLVSLAVLVPSQALPASDLATVTLVEGQPSVLRGAQRLLLSPGAALQADDIVETGPGGFVQAEAGAGPGPVLGLGPDTRLLLDAGRGGPPVPWLLAGWVKYAVPEGGRPSLAAALRLRRAELSAIVGTVVVQSTGDEVRLFAESATLAVSEREAGRAAQKLKPGQAWTLGADGKPRVAARPEPAFMSAMPVVFRDTLPSMLARVAGRRPALKAAPPPSHAELEPWLIVDDPALRGRLAQRFAPRLEDPAFRRAAQAGLARHPEWQGPLSSFKNP